MALYPFLTLHMKSLGISITEIGIQFAISPIACLVATPLVGLIADKIGKCLTERKPAAHQRRPPDNTRQS